MGNIDTTHITENAMKVLAKRYLRKDDRLNVIETPTDMFKRVAINIAEAERVFDPDINVDEVAASFFDIIDSFLFLPNSPTLMNAGRELQQLSACFVLPVDDSMESIFDGVKNTALIHKSGGGTGFSFSRIRPKNDVVQSTKGASSGPVSFMTVFNAATEVIKQGGTRRGANMGILRVDHPDIEDFILSKQDNDMLTNFNISVGITDYFMECVEQDKDFPLVNPHSKTVAKIVSASKLFDTIVSLAWNNGEPGIIFLDQINRYNPTPLVGELESTNPCGEQPLLPYESCNLGSINLGKMVSHGSVDYELLEKVVHLSVRFLDNVIEKNNFPLKPIKEMTQNNRKIGLGVMGFADMLIKLNVPYNSEQALQIADEVMSFINKTSKLASEELALKRGPFPNFKGSIYDEEGSNPLRNATTTTIAPTGTISILANASSGIEPLFAVVFVRKNVLDDDEMIEVHPLFEKVIRSEGIYSENLIKKIASAGSLQKIQGIPDYIKNLFVTAHDISPEWHIKMQAAFQVHTDNAVSKTVNLPHEATKEDVEKIYWSAYRSGCKGVTVYRNGSREKQVLNIVPAEEDQPETNDAEASKYSSTAPRPTEVKGVTREMITGCGKIYVTMNENENGLFEVFANMGKAGGCASSQTEAIGRLVSLALRSGVDPEAIVEELMGISCHQPSGFGNNKIRSCADAIAKAISLHLEMQENEIQQSQPRPPQPLIYPVEGTNGDVFNFSRGACPECGGVIEHEGGCAFCRCCGYSDCL
ncbi:vitamin B12-dependent ribonucleotide reductase [candidate division CSSED10-310 bacterium]|uniref:Vitamin B12-dependent ribonucleotide reductase n=1 Tax=candidate division CSSED10-310 bacterium TaxID=2855610 RepID=A0ABV6YR29_UNCC1